MSEFVNGSEFLQQIIDEIGFNPEDFEIVVRCKDCVFCSIGVNDVEPLCWCFYWLRGTDPVGYCSHGERREDGADDAE